MSIQILCQKFYDFSRYEKNFSPRTIQRYRQIILFYCKHSQINNIEEVNLDNLRNLFYHGRSNLHWTTSTYLSYYKTLRVFFRWCIKEGYMHISNPAEGMELPKVEKCLPKALSKHDAERILETIRNYPYQSKFLRLRNYAIFATLVYTGIRKQELLNLKYADVDIENLTLFIRQGKGSKDRIVPMNYILAEALKQYSEIRNKVYKTCPEYFASYTYDIGFTDSGFKRLINKVSICSGIKFTAHIIRHTFATLMLEGGCDLFSLSKFLGHTDIKTTTIYLGASVQHLRQQILRHPLN